MASVLEAIEAVSAIPDSETDALFWCSDILTGSQTNNTNVIEFEVFWCSDILTGSQTPSGGRGGDTAFWCSDILTGSQTRLTIRKR